MFFHPRNKNLAIGSLIEALLYDAQRAHSTRFELLRWLEEVADHCTGCHKCLKPCPVDIDSGEVSVLEKRILASWGYKTTTPATKATLRYLDSRSPAFNALFRSTVVKIGGAVQRAACDLAGPLQPADGRPGSYALQMLRSPVYPAPAETLRDVIPACDPDQVLVFEPEGEPERTVFYFPGCGSERLQSQISMAALHVLVSLGTRVILPPPFLCCGYPAHFNAKTDQHTRNVLRDTIIFSQIREMFSYLTFDACVVTCGTCREGLTEMDAGKIFGGRLVDVAAYAAERGLKVGANGAEGLLYHAPCHDSLEGKAAEVLVKLGGFGKVEAVPHCCSEAGTLALSRPDITDAMLHRKRGALEEAMSGRRGVTILTNCPSCVQGLGRNRPMGVEPKHLAVALAERMSGEGWLAAFRVQAAKAHAVHF
jgi:Fe-S oxidoreductase